MALGLKEAADRALLAAPMARWLNLGLAAMGGIMAVALWTGMRVGATLCCTPLVLCAWGALCTVPSPQHPNHPHHQPACARSTSSRVIMPTTPTPFLSRPRSTQVGAVVAAHPATTIAWGQAALAAFALAMYLRPPMPSTTVAPLVAPALERNAPNAAFFEYMAQPYETVTGSAF